MSLKKCKAKKKNNNKNNIDSFLIWFYEFSFQILRWWFDVGFHTIGASLVAIKCLHNTKEPIKILIRLFENFRQKYMRYKTLTHRCKYWMLHQLEVDFLSQWPIANYLLSFSHIFYTPNIKETLPNPMDLCTEWSLSNSCKKQIDLYNN